MYEKFLEGDAIANSLDPSVPGFLCGSVIANDGDGYWIKLPDNSRARISPTEAISLVDVLAHNPETCIAADMSMWDEERVFVGGVIDDFDIPAQRYAVRIPQGVTYMHCDRSMIIVISEDMINLLTDEA